MDPRKLLEAIEKLSAVRRVEAEDFIRYLAEREEPAENGNGKTDAIQHYLDHPFVIADVKAPTREELYRGR